MKRKQTDAISKKQQTYDDNYGLITGHFYKAWYQGKIKMSAISKEKIKICVLTKIQDIWTE